MTQHGVVIAGGGPTGLMLAGELALAGVDVVVVERRATQELAGARAGGLSARTLEVLDQRGIVARFLAEGQVAQVVGFASARLDISDFPTRHPYGLGLWQNHIERLLAAWVDALDVPVLRARDVTTFTQDAHGVHVQLSDGATLRAQYLVGCDGGRSVVRTSAGIGFTGCDASTSSILAEVEMTEAPPLGIHRTAIGIHSFGRREYDIRDGVVVFRDTGPIRVMVTDAQVTTGTPTLEDLRDALIAVCGTDYGVHSPTWLSRFSDASRQAVSYRDRRVLLAGDAAHVHSPVGGQGLNTGVQDAVNLGWKLAQVVTGTSSDRLLDSYHAERFPVAARVLRTTLAQVAMLRDDPRSTALRETMAELVVLDEPRRRLGAELSGLGIRYALGDGHPLLGRRMPDLDLDLHTVGGVVRVFTLLHAARWVLLDLGAAVSLDLSGWSDRVQVIRAAYGGVWELPAIGPVPAPQAVLVRPDGYVAWVGEGGDGGLHDVLRECCGAERGDRAAVG